jgi:hypothetical protein
VDEPIDGLGGADPDPDDLKRVTVSVRWSGGGDVTLSRLFPAD